jgi:hypothetical protein
MAFINRGTVSLAALDRQMTDIDLNGSRLADFYERRVIDAIRSDGTFTSAAGIFATIFG